MQKGVKLGCKKGCKYGQNMCAIAHTKLDAKLHTEEVDVRVDAKWDEKNIKNI